MAHPEGSTVETPAPPGRDKRRQGRGRLWVGFGLALVWVVVNVAWPGTASAAGGCYNFTIGNLTQASSLNKKVSADQYMKPALRKGLMGQYRGLVGLAASVRKGTHRFCVEWRKFERRRIDHNRRIQINKAKLARHNKDAAQFDAQCSGRRITIGSAQWNRCKSWRSRLVSERAPIMAIDRSLVRERADLNRKRDGLNRWRANNKRKGSSRVRKYVKAAQAALASDLAALLARLDALVKQLPKRF